MNGTNVVNLFSRPKAPAPAAMPVRVSVMNGKVAPENQRFLSEEEALAAMVADFERYCEIDPDEAHDNARAAYADLQNDSEAA